MKSYKYVKFSRKTAKVNSGMILREYNNILESLNGSIQELYKERFKCKISVGNIRRNYDTETVVEFDGDYFDLKNVVEQIERKRSDIIENIQKIRLVKKERSRFEQEFVLRMGVRRL
jgi:hypothetical protein